ncbi:MAG: hemerythrin domain-containing protein [Terracidiphilus sp.]|jgi:hemerythrin
MELSKETINLSVGVRILDRDHQEMAETIHELKAAALADQDRSLTVPLLRKLARFTMNHFAFEEGMMQATRFPGMAVHRLNHLYLLGELGTLISHHAKGDLPLDPHSLGFLSEWHSNHIHSDDLHYGLWLNAIGKIYPSKESWAEAKSLEAGFASEARS